MCCRRLRRVTTACADHVAPQSLEEKALTVVRSTYATTTRPHVDPAAAPGGGGWTSVTAPVPADASGVPAGADHVAPPSVDLMT